MWGLRAIHDTQIQEEKSVVHGRILLGLAYQSTTQVQIPLLRTQLHGHTKVQGRLGNVMPHLPEERRNSLVEKCLASQGRWAKAPGSAKENGKQEPVALYEGKEHKARGLQLDFCLSTWKMGIMTGEPPLDSGRCG